MTVPTARGEVRDLIGGEWVSLRVGDGERNGIIESRNPARPAEVIARFRPSLEHVGACVRAGRGAFAEWSAWPIERRATVLATFRDIAAREAGRVADTLCDEVGKVMWEARQEAALLASKVDITLETGVHSGRLRVTGFELTPALSATRRGACAFRAHGVLAVLGPFNFPAHLPNGHIVPALLMGNCVVFKPSDKAPATGQLLAELLQEALAAHGAPKGVLGLVQGGADIASALARHEEVDGVLFTGSFGVGRRILEANLDTPGRIVALEMGGNNPAVVLPDADLRQAAIEIVRCAFNTAGQRCTSTRRAILHKDIAARMRAAICTAASNLIVGDPRAAHPVFMGPMISREARESVLEFQRGAARSGGRVLVEATEVGSPGGGWFVSPGVIGVDRFTKADEGSDDPRRDAEVFGPVLRISEAGSLEDAIEQANATRFGLAASVFTRDSAAADRFARLVRAGCVNVNTGTAGASSRLPFGGLGRSGNHRPAGSFALDYCAYPQAMMHETGSVATIAEGMRFEDSWLG